MRSSIEAERARLGMTKGAMSSAQFTWPEVCKINSYFFPDMAPNDLFARCDGGR